MATDKYSWDKDPTKKLTPAVVKKRWGAKARIVRSGGKWRLVGREAPRVRTGVPLPKPTVTQLGLAPREWQGSEGLIGSWKKEPRLNPEQYEWTQNEFGRWFARPRTEFTGLNTQQRRDIQNADAYANRHRESTTASWNEAANAQQDYNTKTQEQLNQLNAQVGNTTLTDPTSVASSHVTRANHAATVAPTIAGLGREPGVIRAEGLGRADQFGAAWGAQRSNLIAGYRTAQQEAEAAARGQDAEMSMELLRIQQQAADSTLNNQTRLEVAGLNAESGLQRESIRAQTQITLGKLKARTAQADRAARMLAKAATLDNQLQIARERNQTQRANAILREKTKLETTAARLNQQAGRVAQGQLNQWSKVAREMFRGIERATPGGGVSISQYPPAVIQRHLVAMGAPPDIAREITESAGYQAASQHPWPEGLGLGQHDPRLRWPSLLGGPMTPPPLYTGPAPGYSRG